MTSLIAEATSPVKAIFDVVAQVFAYIIGLFKQIPAMFFDSSSGLTFFGVLLVIGLSIGLFLLVMGIIQSWVRLRS